MKFCVALEEVSPAGEVAIGGKARSLRRLAAAGLPVPRAFVVTTALFHALREGGPPLRALAEPHALDGDAAVALLDAAWPPGFVDELGAALVALGPGHARFAVRSSATLEDRADALGAGLFLSRTDVAPEDVAAAVREVLATAVAPAARAYAGRRELTAGDLAMAVLVHPFTPGDAAGTVAFDPRLQDAPEVELTVGVAPAKLTVAARARIAGAARAGAVRFGACELEWVARGDDVLFLQQRPFRAPTRDAPAWRWASDLADGPWTWDAAHNPLPLSPAQAGLVAHVDAHCRTPFRQRVVGGYLFTRSAPLASPTSVDARDALVMLARDAEAKLAALGPAASLEETLGIFSAVYGPLFASVQPASRAAREALAAFLATHGQGARLSALLAGVPSVATERARRATAIAGAPNDAERVAAVASYVTLFGDEAPAWDVAVPTHAEDPSALERIPPGAAAPAPSPDAAVALEAALPEAARAEGRALLAAARAGAAVAEDDDALYARVQARVRHALLREGLRLRAANVLAREGDIFGLPFEAVRRDARGEESFTAATVTRLLAEAHEALAAALADPPPLPRTSADADHRDGVRGRAASGGRAVGRVHLHEPGARVDVPAGAVLVARTLLPTELPLLAPAAIVVETGGPLGHVAAQARERALPAVVDAPGACAAFRAGDLVLVDGDAGVAIRLGP